AGARTLRNEKPFALAGKLDLAALDLDSDYFSHGRQIPLTGQDVERFLDGRPDPSRFTILIAHEPSRFAAYASWGADLVLSGHVHGGVARLSGRGVINPALKLFPFYDGGAFVRVSSPDGPNAVIAGGARAKTNADGVIRHPDDKMIYLERHQNAMIESRGLGTHSIHVRFLNPGELVVIRLHPGEDMAAGAPSSGTDTGESTQETGEFRNNGIGSKAAGV
ncbi:MAG: hypothetical protein IJU50_07860, partial [Lachnospiraceae bacterium]|nr:hypothetical protein [Lachnospiraceae bacterium]